jgi:hypothetical protein
LGLTDADMPALFTDADTASLAGQATYLRLVKADIALVILAARVGSISPTDPTAKTVVAFLTAGLFGLSIIVRVSSVPGGTSSVGMAVAPSRNP